MRECSIFNLVTARIIFKTFYTHANQLGILAVHLTFEEERELLRKASTSGNKNDSFGRRRLDIVK